jgi:double-strand break repair protein MRE11
MEMLSITKILSYIGKVQNFSDIVFRPTIFLKGKVAVCIYGIGHIKDSILVEIFRTGKYRFESVPEEVWNNYKCIKILLMHQNRDKGSMGGSNSSIKFNTLPPGFQFVIWGHEHDCLPNTFKLSNPDVEIYQPGSSVAISLSEGEALRKHCGILKVFEDGSHKLEYVPLYSTRMMIYKDMDYLMFKERDGLNEPKSQEEIIESISDKIMELIEDAKTSIFRLMK